MLQISDTFQKSQHKISKEKFDLSRWKFFKKFQYKHFSWLKLLLALFEKRIIKGNADEHVALETKLGYVLSKKLDIGSNGHQTNLSESLVTNVLRVQQEGIDPKEQLNEIVQKFWNLESTGVSESKLGVCEDFKGDISFTNNHNNY